MARVELANYPGQRPARLPLSPLAHVRQGFERILTSPNREIFRTAFMQMESESREWEDRTIGPEKTYKEYKRGLVNDVQRAVAENDHRLLTWLNISEVNYVRYSEGAMIDEISKSSRLDRTERVFIDHLLIYTGHETTHIAPRAILSYGVNNITAIFPIRESMNNDIPSKAWQFFKRFAEYINDYHDYFERQTAIGAAFFARDSELPGLPAISGSELPAFIDMVADAFALRFLSAYFAVSPKGAAGKIEQNAILIDIDPGLGRMRLPLMLVAPKIACDVKNIMRITAESEMRSGKPTSLKIALDDKPIDKPVSFTISGRKVTDKVWELRLSDNGKGILVGELFRPIVYLSHNFPEAVSPALRNAALKWEAGDPFAFNNIPLGDLLEAVFQLGVSTGTTRGRGMGLWGSMAMLTRLGAQIKVGVTPTTAGFYQSILLPMDLSVSAAEVKSAADRFWQSKSFI